MGAGPACLPTSLSGTARPGVQSWPRSLTDWGHFQRTAIHMNTTVTRRSWAMIGLAVLVLGAAGALVSWNRGPVRRPEVSTELARAVQEGRDTIIDLRSFTAFEWTDVFVVPPYTSEARAEEAMGIRWSGRWSDIDVRDGFSLLVFLDAQKPVAVVEHPRHLGDFAAGSGIQHFGPLSARFLVRRDSSRLLLVPAGTP